MKLYTQLNNFEKIFRFKDSDHSYTHLPTGRKMTSATTVLKYAADEFRTDYWVTYKAVEALGYEVKSDSSYFVQKGYIRIDGTSFLYTDVYSGASGHIDPSAPLLLKKQWELDAAIGNTRGSIIHDYMENLWVGKIFVDRRWDHLTLDGEDKIAFETSIKNAKRLGCQFWLDHQHLVPIKLEQIVGSEQLGVAGQMDALFYNTLTDEYVIYDYKTDRKLDRSNSFQNFHHPISHIEDCAFNKYALQLSIYKVLLEKYTDIKIASCKIVWLLHSAENYQVIDLPDMTTEARNLLAHNMNR